MSLSQTIARLQRGRGAFAAAYQDTSRARRRPSDRLVELEGFANPGNLGALYYAPHSMPHTAPLLVVLHGCTQDAASYDHGAGWSHLAERHGFALLYPEQRRENNPNLCFNWFQRGDATRGNGEAASIAAMVRAMKERLPIDGANVFVTGLSAGGAMASVMLATYPELFAGGAVIAGMPFGCASNLGEAFELMAGHGDGDPSALADKVRSGARHDGVWPRLSVWHGSADRIVAPANADALVAQWTAVHGLGAQPHRVESINGHCRRVWLSRGGDELVEQYVVRGMAHGTPLMPGTGDGESGEAGAHMLDVGLSSTDRIAAFFGIAPEAKASAGAKVGAGKQATAARGAESAPAVGSPQLPGSIGSIQQQIEKALRGAGLLR